MILSISRRTDIPAFYAEWFFHCVKEGFACVRNPMNPRWIRTVSLRPEDVECMVFWTKNPLPMLSRLDEIRLFNYYFQFTLTPYGRDLECRLPDKDVLAETFRRLSDKIGEERVVWRYDPVLMSREIDETYHLSHFEKTSRQLASYTKRCVLSFVDLYRKTRKSLSDTTVREVHDEEIVSLAGKMAAIARSYGMEIQTCAEKADLSAWGITHGKCIDDKRIETISGRSLNARKDKYQRRECGCVESVDIGAYDTCLHHCLYCYAGVASNCRAHHPHSPLLVGEEPPK